MKYCRKCGAQLADDDTYCYFCGANLEEQQKEAEKERPTFSDQSYYEDKYEKPETNGVALAGFVFSFISPLIGFILSIVGLNKAKQLRGVGRGYAIAGIIISVVSFIATCLIYMYLYGSGIGE